MMEDVRSAAKRFKQLVDILDVLRSENGCPWDRMQNEKSILDYFLEEVYEAVDALERNDSESFREELGDVLLEVVFFAQIFKEKGIFSIADVVHGINQKMIKRHPHVFGKEKIEDSQSVQEEWSRRKKTEKERSSYFEGLPENAPALLMAFQIGRLASVQGFDWDKPAEVMEKLQEEVKELEEVVKADDKTRIAEEMGDILFAMANLSRHLEVNPELALRKANLKFIRRFKFIERELEKQGKKVADAGKEEMEILWERAKKDKQD